MKTLNLLAVALLGLSSQAATADSVVEWNLTGAAGNQTATAASSAAAHIAGMDMTRGAGLTASSATNGFSASGWTAQDSDYFSFGFTVEAGYEVDLTDLTFATRSSNTGPGLVGLFYSGDNFATALTTFDQSGGGYINSVVDLSALDDLSGAVEFRLMAIGTTAANGGTTGSSGTFRIAEYLPVGAANTVDVAFTGAIAAAVPEAETYAMMLAGLGLVGFAARRKSV